MMTVEIKELVIRTVVDATTEDAINKHGLDVTRPVNASQASTEIIVQECVRQVMRIMARNKER